MLSGVTTARGKTQKVKNLFIIPVMMLTLFLGSASSDEISGKAIFCNGKKPNGLATKIGYTFNIGVMRVHWISTTTSEVRYRSSPLNSTYFVSDKNISWTVTDTEYVLDRYSLELRLRNLNLDKIIAVTNCDVMTIGELETQMENHLTALEKEFEKTPNKKKI